MGDLRERPLRLESSLTQEYVNRQVKMAEFDRYSQTERRRWTMFQKLVGWVVLGVLLTFALVVWVTQ